MGQRLKDLRGQRFGRLVVVKRIGQGAPTTWICQCDCGNTSIVTSANLRHSTQSCGCFRREQKIAQMKSIAGWNAADLTGQRFGKLIVLERANGYTRRTFWRCRCDCGHDTVKMGKYLSNGDTQSCGCDQKAYRSGLHRKYREMAGRYRAEYTAWRSMISRCYVRSTSHFRDYGGRGVTVCARWRYDFIAFLKDMGPRPPKYSLDRIDPFGNYEPSNCRWATWKTQANNQRRHHAAMSSS